MKEGGECDRYKAGLEPHGLVIDVPLQHDLQVQGTRKTIRLMGDR